MEFIQGGQSVGQSVPNSDGGILVGTGNPTPVTWSSFEASLLPSRAVELNWATAQEVNNDYFEVEKRLDNGEFQPIAQVDGAGNASNTTSYRFIDESPLGSVNHYRLRQVDFDGTFSYSEVREVRLDGASLPLNVYPNPATEQVTLSLPAAGGTYRLSIMDVTGRSLQQQTLQAEAGQRELTLDLSRFAAGTYQLLLQSPEGQTYRSKLVKQ